MAHTRATHQGDAPNIHPRCGRHDLLRRSSWSRHSSKSSYPIQWKSDLCKLLYEYTNRLTMLSMRYRVVS